MKKKNIISPKNTMTREDWEKWGKNVLTFSTPALLLFLTALAGGKTFQEASSVLYLAIINALIDLLKKYTSEVK